MKYKIDTTTWKRREHYEFFNGMDDPMGGKTKRAMLSESDCVGSADGSVS